MKLQCPLQLVKYAIHFVYDIPSLVYPASRAHELINYNCIVSFATGIIFLDIYNYFIHFFCVKQKEAETTEYGEKAESNFFFKNGAFSVFMYPSC